MSEAASNPTNSLRERNLADEVREAGINPDELRNDSGEYSAVGDLELYQLPPVEPEETSRPTSICQNQHRIGCPLGHHRL